MVSIGALYPGLYPGTVYCFLRQTAPARATAESRQLKMYTVPRYHVWLSAWAIASSSVAVNNLADVISIRALSS